jgi:hypothetical protein
MVGRHVMWHFDAGVAARHDAYTAAHEGACPPGCRPLPWAPPADPTAPRPVTEAWLTTFGKRPVKIAQTDYGDSAPIRRAAVPAVVAADDTTITAMTLRPLPEDPYA